MIYEPDFKRLDELLQSYLNLLFFIESVRFGIQPSDHVLKWLE